MYNTILFIATTPSFTAWRTQAVESWVLLASTMVTEDIVARSMGGFFDHVAAAMEHASSVPVKVRLVVYGV